MEQTAVGTVILIDMGRCYPIGRFTLRIRPQYAEACTRTAAFGAHRKNRFGQSKPRRSCYRLIAEKPSAGLIRIFKKRSQGRSEKQMSRKIQKLPAAMPTGSFLLTVGVGLETTTYSNQSFRRLSPYRTLSGNEKHEVQTAKCSKAETFAKPPSVAHFCVVRYSLD